MFYIIEKGTNQHVIFLLHGTGGDAKSMLDLGKRHDPEATLISIEGAVNENGMNRYFARFPNGSFDLDSLAEETAKLFKKIEALIVEHNLASYRKTILGYSNGANIATNLFKDFTTDFDQAMLYHPSGVRPDVPFKPQAKLRVFMTYGHGDPYLTEADFKFLKQQFEAADIRVVEYIHNQGHQLINEELNQANLFLK